MCVDLINADMCDAAHYYCVHTLNDLDHILLSQIWIVFPTLCVVSRLDSHFCIMKPCVFTGFTSSHVDEI